MVKIDTGSSIFETPPSQQASSLGEDVTGSFRSWCRCHYHVLMVRETPSGLIRYREFCPCCMSGRVRNDAGVGLKRAVKDFGSIRVSRAIEYEEMTSLKVTERLPIARQWRRRIFYLEHLASEKWQRMRAEVISRDKGRCTCGAKGTDVHHLTYENLGQEELEDLILLCRSCHQKEHFHEF